ncbi:glycosyltransferase family 22 protein [Pleomassaria siparia CBS 279.74]|uniref:Mannosyltransferase n=1 Tax=Pleomassaria siparia CBS 279.74 TaxID=1314801 RepID=A0A6G1K9I4_9PLEO|nr:glycosyltransferase family 22 protein [Pleomassaria siparia CBS 279.74]
MPKRRPSEPSSYRQTTLTVVAIVLAVRIVNALTLRTFFQPDEFFQSLEPAWQLAFGPASNAWITWEWRSQLRSSLHPAIFATVYQVAAKVAALSLLSPPAEAALLIAAPKVVQAVFAALLDCYTWKLAEKVYSRPSRTAFTSLALSLCSPWQWFCSTRTLSNCLETTITSIAVYYWPWYWPEAAARAGRFRNHHGKTHVVEQDMPGSDSVPQLRLSLLLAAFACILRPTNILIWLAISIPTIWQSSSRQRSILVREIFFAGSVVLSCSVLADRVYYQAWTLPPLRFLHFNIVQSLAVFYGTNRVDYYLTEGLPLLLTTALPFAVVGSWQALSRNPVREFTSVDVVPRRILARLAWTTLFVTLALSAISHKEVRFLYPVLPFLHVLAAGPLMAFFSPQVPYRRAILVLLVAVNLLIAGYTSQIHQRGVIDVLDYLRHKHEAQVQISASDVAPSSGKLSGIGQNGTNIYPATTVAFFMPCHSTPWRSHFVHSSIAAWALTCEPPIDVPLSQRSTYLDEADEFYINPGPVAWLARNMQDAQSTGEGEWGKRPWPQNVVFFEQLEETMKQVLGGTVYSECWRGFNTHFHDDSRRVGDVIVWCRE